jgi:uncharacterized Zn finger protein
VRELDLPIDSFECPVCSAREFAALVVTDAQGREREANGLYRCKSCGFCFADVASYCSRHSPRP